MPLTARSGRERPAFGRPAPMPTLTLLLLLAAVPHRVAELLALVDRGRLDLRAYHVAHGGHPVGHDVPLLAVPLLDQDRAAALVILAAHLHGMGEALHAELIQARLGEAQVLEAPPHLLTGEGLVAELRHRGPDGLGAEHGVDEPAVVERRAHL